MFGSSVFNRLLSFIFLFLNFDVAFARDGQLAVIIEDQAIVYREPDFDAPVIANLKVGSVFEISKKNLGPFYKIQLKDGKVGWISDTDIRKKGSEDVGDGDSHGDGRPKRPFFATRYRGPAFDYINFTENTMGKNRSAALSFYGLRFSGYNTVMEGEIYADASLLFHSGAPEYYEKATQKNASGMIVIADFTLQTLSILNKSLIYYYGLGPMMKFSHFDLNLPNGLQTVSYSADDFSIGVLLDLGLTMKVGKSAIRTDLKYYIERSRYTGVGFGLGWEY